MPCSVGNVRAVNDVDRSRSEHPKVLGVGVFKTGTTSFRDGLRSAGLRVTGPDGRDLLAAGCSHDQVVAEVLASIAPRFDGFQDYPWFSAYAQFDRAFPESQYVLTVRNDEDWWLSMLHQFGRKRIPHLVPSFGHERVLGHKREFIRSMRQHNDAVQEYFAGREDQLFVMDVTKEDVAELSSFLGLQEGLTLPHANRDSDKLHGLGPARSFRSRARRKIFDSVFG